METVERWGTCCDEEDFDECGKMAARLMSSPWRLFAELVVLSSAGEKAPTVFKFVDV